MKLNVARSITDAEQPWELRSRQAQAKKAGREIIPGRGKTSDRSEEARPSFAGIIVLRGGIEVSRGGSEYCSRAGRTRSDAEFRSGARWPYSYCTKE